MKSDEEDNNADDNWSNKRNSSSSTDTSDSDIPKRSPLRYQRNLIHQRLDNTFYPRDPDSALSKYPFGEPNTNIESNTHSKGPGGELRQREPVQTALPQHRLREDFNPDLHGRYANTNQHLQQICLNSQGDEFRDQLRGNSCDNHGLPHVNLVNDAQQLVTQTFSETVAAHSGMSPAPHRRMLVPQRSSTPLSTIPCSPSGQTSQADEPQVISTFPLTTTVRTVTMTAAFNGPWTTVAFSPVHVSGLSVTSFLSNSATAVSSSSNVSMSAPVPLDLSVSSQNSQLQNLSRPVSVSQIPLPTPPPPRLPTVPVQTPGNPPQTQILVSPKTYLQRNCNVEMKRRQFETV